MKVGYALSSGMFVCCVSGYPGGEAMLADAAVDAVAGAERAAHYGAQEENGT